MTELSGCSRIFPKLDQVLPDKRKEYKKSESLPDLEVPPELSTGSIQDSMPVPDVDQSGSATFSNYLERQAAKREGRPLPSAPRTATTAPEDDPANTPAEVTDPNRAPSTRTRRQASTPTAAPAPAPAGAQSTVTDAGGELRAVVKGDAEDVWPKLTRFWKNGGYRLELDDQKLAVLETAWKNQANSRERFRVFGGPASGFGKTELFLRREAESKNGGSWAAAPRDPAREREVLGRLMNALGGSAVATSSGGQTGASSTASTRTASSGGGGGRAVLVSSGTGKLYLRVPVAIDSAWTKTATALEDTGIEIEDKDRSLGVYTLRYAPGAKTKESGGFLSKLAFWKDNGQRYRLVLADMDGRTEIVVLDSKGTWDNSPIANDILSKLRDRLNRG